MPRCTLTQVKAECGTVDDLAPEGIVMTNSASRDRFGYVGTEIPSAAAGATLEMLARAALLADEWADKAKKPANAVDAGQEGLADIVRREPLAALGLATAASFVLALLVRRK